MERVVRKAHSFQEADAQDVAQQVAMTPNERMLAARALAERAYPDAKDVRACHGRG